jgi:tetratricopeptide (TPR) repeat protein
VPLALTTHRQLSQWETTEKLMRHALQVAGPSETVHRCLAFMLTKDGKLEEAVREFRAGLELDPNSFPGMLGLGVVYANQGKDDEAERLFRRALADYPSVAAHFQLADFLQERGRLDEAKVHYLHGLALAPYYAKARNDLGNVYARQNNWAAAREQYDRALKLNPRAAEIHQNLGRLLEIQGNETEAVKNYQTALALNPEFATAHFSLGQVLARRGDLAAAKARFEAALKYQTNNAQAHFALAGVFEAEKQDARAIFHLREAVRWDTNGVPALNNLAWLLATHPEITYRDGKQAVEFARRAVELTRTNDATALDTMAASYAEAGQFAEAVQTAKKAIGCAKSSGAAQMAGEIEARLRLYEKSQPFREPAHEAVRPATRD